MIRLDLKEKLESENLTLDDVFFKHRTGIDQPGYRVGKVGEEVVVLNENTKEIMDFFYDDAPEIEWFSLGFINDVVKNYEINRRGSIRNKNKNLKKILTLQKTKSGYNEIKLLSRKHNFSKHLFIHRALGFMFVPNLNPETNKLIDHIDRNRQNNTLTNLRWVSVLENNRNFKKPPVNRDTIFYEYSDKQKTDLIRVYTGEEIRARFGEDYKRFRKEVVRRKYNRYDETYWDIEVRDVLKYLTSIGKTIDEISDEDFVYNPIYNVLIHPFGVVKFITLKDSRYLSAGSIHGGYRRIRSNTMVHVVVASTFLNDCKEIPNGLQVDHINGDCLDNRLENLRIVTPSENMSNENTKDKIKNIKSMSTSYLIVNNEGKTFTMKDCVEYYKVGEDTIRRWIKDNINGLRYIIEET